HRRRVATETRPNAGHEALAALERTGPDLTLVTQNVDGLPRRAGSRRVVELHGSLTRTYCIDCGADAAEADLAEADLAEADLAEADDAGSGEPTRCRACGGYLRPGVVWFGEALPEAALAEAYAAAERADVFLSVGTSAVVYPAAHLPVYAREQG